MREVLLIVHIAAVAAWLGASGAQFVILPTMTRRGGETAEAWMTTFVRLGRIYYTPAALLILASGIGLVIDSTLYDFEHVFVVVGVLMVLIGGALGGAFYGPKGRLAAEAYGSGDDQAGRAQSTRIAQVGALEVVLLVVTVAGMVYRWGV